MRLAPLLAVLLLPAATPTQAFGVGFHWPSTMPLCTSGRPNLVANPVFSLSDVPKGTRFLRFRMTDLQVPAFRHGGGLVPYRGEKTVPRGAFRYKSPCPPGGHHVYEWTVTALRGRSGGVLGTATARRRYP